MVDRQQKSHLGLEPGSSRAKWCCLAQNSVGTMQLMHEGNAFPLLKRPSVGADKGSLPSQARLRDTFLPVT